MDALFTSSSEIRRDLQDLRQRRIHLEARLDALQARFDARQAHVEWTNAINALFWELERDLNAQLNTNTAEWKLGLSLREMLQMFQQNDPDLCSSEVAVVSRWLDRFLANSSVDLQQFIVDQKHLAELLFGFVEDVREGEWRPVQQSLSKEQRAAVSAAVRLLESAAEAGGSSVQLSPTIPEAVAGVVAAIPGDEDDSEADIMIVHGLLSGIVRTLAQRTPGPVEEETGPGVTNAVTAIDLRMQSAPVPARRFLCPLPTRCSSRSHCSAPIRSETASLLRLVLARPSIFISVCVLFHPQSSISIPIVLILATLDPLDPIRAICMRGADEGRVIPTPRS